MNRLSVFDWCDGNGGHFDRYYTIDDGFRDRYIRNFGDGLPKATIEIAQPIGQGGEWKAMIYNYSSNVWEDLDARGPGVDPDPSNDYAWATFETHYNPGPCPAFPTIGVRASKSPSNLAETTRKISSGRRRHTICAVPALT
jgi:hypothetical protein